MEIIIAFAFTIFEKFKGWVIGAGAVGAALLFAFLKGRKSGRDAAIAKDRKELQKDVERKRKIDEDVNSATDSDVDKRLQRWVKD